MPVVRGHRRVGVAHDQVDGGLVLGFASDCFECVAESVEIAMADDAVSVGDTLEAPPHGIDVRPFGRIIVRCHPNVAVPVTSDENATGIGHVFRFGPLFPNLLQRLDGFWPKWTAPVDFRFRPGKENPPSFQIDRVPLQIGDVLLPETAVDAQENHRAKNGIGVVYDRPKFVRDEMFLTMYPIRFPLCLLVRFNEIRARANRLFDEFRIKRILEQHTPHAPRPSPIGERRAIFAAFPQPNGVSTAMPGNLRNLPARDAQWPCLSRKKQLPSGRLRGNPGMIPARVRGIRADCF